MEEHNVGEVFEYTMPDDDRDVRSLIFYEGGASCSGCFFKDLLDKCYMMNCMAHLREDGLSGIYVEI